MVCFAEMMFRGARLVATPVLSVRALSTKVYPGTATLAKVLYTGSATAAGTGRDGTVKTFDGSLSAALVKPKVGV